MTLAWADAHRLAVVTATRLARRCELDMTRRVPVFEVAERLGIVVRFAPLPRLAGAYIHQDGVAPGVLINTRHPPAKQRYTCAHELGHHTMGHGTNLDPETEVEPVESGPVPEHERVAEAFAEWFLMPRPLIQHLVGALFNDALARAEDVYRLSLRLGTSFVATLRHLVNLRILEEGPANDLAKTAPQRIKQALAGDPWPGIGAADVHLITRRDADGEIMVTPGDLIVVETDTGTGSDADIDADGIATPISASVAATLTGTKVRLRVIDSGPENPAAPAKVARLRVGADGARDWAVTVVLEPRRVGVSEHWFADTGKGEP